MGKYQMQYTCLFLVSPTFEYSIGNKNMHDMSQICFKLAMADNLFPIATFNYEITLNPKLRGGLFIYHQTETLNDGDAGEKEIGVYFMALCCCLSKYLNTCMKSLIHNQSKSLHQIFAVWSNPPHCFPSNLFEPLLHRDAPKSM